MTTEKALLPCPFCGGEAEFEREGTRSQSCIVTCVDCGARHESGDQDWCNGLSWNRRAALSIPETVGEPVAKVADAPDPAPESVDEPAEKASEQIIGSDGKAFPKTFDAQAWAKAFNETLTALGDPQHDEGWLIGWFANAIMRGFDEANWRAAPPSQPAAQGEAATDKLRKLDAIIQETREYLDMVEMLSDEPDLDRSDTLRLLGVLNDYRAMLATAPAASTNGEGA